MHMYVQRAKLPRATATSFESPLPALMNIHSNVKRSTRGNLGSQLCSEGGGRGLKASTSNPGVKKKN